jgi:hypothetical protein
MEAIKSIVQLPKRTVKTPPMVQTGLVSITAMEQELNRLINLFSAASFVLTAHDVQSLDHMCCLYARLKMEVADHIQNLKLNSIATRRPLSKLQMNLDARLEREILGLKTQIQTFTSKLFHKASGKRHIL